MKKQTKGILACLPFSTLFFYVLIGLFLQLTLEYQIFLGYSIGAIVGLAWGLWQILKMEEM